MAPWMPVASVFAEGIGAASPGERAARIGGPAAQSIEAPIWASARSAAWCHRTGWRSVPGRSEVLAIEDDDGVRVRQQRDVLQAGTVRQQPINKFFKPLNRFQGHLKFPLQNDI